MVRRASAPLPVTNLSLVPFNTLSSIHGHIYLSPHPGLYSPHPIGQHRHPVQWWPLLGWCSSFWQPGCTRHLCQNLDSWPSLPKEHLEPILVGGLALSSWSLTNSSQQEILRDIALHGSGRFVLGLRLGNILSSMLYSYQCNSDVTM